MIETEVIRRADHHGEVVTILREDGQMSSCSRLPRRATKVDIKHGPWSSYSAFEGRPCPNGDQSRQGQTSGSLSLDSDPDWKKAYVRLQGGRKNSGSFSRGHRRIGCPERRRRNMTMAIRKLKPTSPGRRFQTIQTSTTRSPTSRSPTEPLTVAAARSRVVATVDGEITVWWRRGGGHKRAYRM